MRRPLKAATLAFLVGLLPSCQQADNARSASLDSGDEKASYGIGLNMGQQLQPTAGRLEMAAFLRGVEDAIAARDPAISREEIAAALQAFSASIQEAEALRREEQATANRAEGEAYLAENGARQGVSTTASGLQYEVLNPAEGPRPSLEDRVLVRYEGTLVDGTVFDSSFERGQAATFAVTGVIAGFTEVLLLMAVGSKYRVVIPSELAYGPQGGRPGSVIGPDATLIFEMELVEILQ